MRLKCRQLRPKVLECAVASGRKAEHGSLRNAGPGKRETTEEGRPSLTHWFWNRAPFFARTPFSWNARAVTHVLPSDLIQIVAPTQVRKTEEGKQRDAGHV